MQTRLAAPCLAPLSGLVAVLWAVPLASAHDKWLEPEPAAARSPMPTKIYLAIGEALRQAEYRPERSRSRTAAFELRTATAKTDLLSQLREDAMPVASLPSVPSGTSLLRMDSRPVEIELSADKFSAYLLEERLIDILAERKQRGEEDAPGRERYSRNLKALLQVGGKVDPGVVTPCGQTLEIVPLSPPHALRSTGPLRVQVLFRGQPLPGVALAAAQRVRGQTHETYQRTDGQGIVTFVVEPRGQWLLHGVHMHRAQGADAAGNIDWRSHWTSLFFAYLDPQP